MVGLGIVTGQGSQVRLPSRGIVSFDSLEGQVLEDMDVEIFSERLG